MAQRSQMGARSGRDRSARRRRGTRRRLRQRLLRAADAQGRRQRSHRRRSDAALRHAVPRRQYFRERREHLRSAASSRGTAADDQHAFDTTFSMGVLYHQRSPIEHLRQLRTTLRPRRAAGARDHLRPGRGILRLHAGRPLCAHAQCLVVADDCRADDLAAAHRLTARSRSSTGRSRAPTSSAPPSGCRSSHWPKRCDADDPGKTVEGWPAPHRVVVTAISP